MQGLHFKTSSFIKRTGIKEGKVMNVLNVNQFLSKERVRINKDYEITSQKEWVYGDGEMILFARRYLKYWKEQMGLNKKAKQALHKHNFYKDRELLILFFKYFRDNGERNIGMTIEQFVDEFLKE